jgi:hypothetical protein
LQTEEELTLRFRHFLHRQKQHRDRLSQRHHKIGVSR